MGPERLPITPDMNRGLLALELSGRIYEFFKKYPALVSVLFY